MSDRLQEAAQMRIHELEGTVAESVRQIENHERENDRLRQSRENWIMGLGLALCCTLVPAALLFFISIDLTSRMEKRDAVKDEAIVERNTTLKNLAAEKNRTCICILDHACDEEIKQAFHRVVDQMIERHGKANP